MASPSNNEHSAALTVPGWPSDRPAYESLAAAVQGEASRWNVLGVAVGILNRGEIETTSTGFANLVTRQPMTDDTISQIGSISKVFTATLAMMLVEEGLLDLDEPVATYVPGLPLADDRAQGTVTLRHLLSHTAGFEGDHFIDYGRGEDALANAIGAFGTLRQWTAPGDLWSYCNAGYYLISRVIEIVAGAPFETVFRERLVEPLGLATAFFYAEDVITWPHAVGHYLKRREEGHLPAHGYSFPRHVNGAGGVVTSTRELLRFAQLHMNDGEIDGARLLPVAAARAMREPVIEAGDVYRHYGLGWCVHDYPEFRTISHGGATRGFRANLTVIPDREFAVAILTNGDAGSRAIQEIEAWALDAHLDFARPAYDRIKVSGKKLDAVTGSYRRHDGTFTVTAVDDRLDLAVVHLDEQTGAAEDEQTYPLVAVGERRYLVPDGPNKDAIVDFIDYEGNGSTQHFLRMGGRLAERDDTALEPAEKVAKAGEAVKDGTSKSGKKGKGKKK